MGQGSDGVGGLKLSAAGWWGKMTLAFAQRAAREEMDSL